MEKGKKKKSTLALAASLHLTTICSVGGKQRIMRNCTPYFVQYDNQEATKTHT
jgi:hypothetical protein